MVTGQLLEAISALTLILIWCLFHWLYTGGDQVAKAAADTVKRVSQGTWRQISNIILPDADLQSCRGGVQSCFNNSGRPATPQPRMLVHRDQHDEAVAIAKATAEKVTVGTPDSEGVVIGPVVSEAQFNRIQDLIQKALDEGLNWLLVGLADLRALIRAFL